VCVCVCVCVCGYCSALHRVTSLQTQLLAVMIIRVAGVVQV